MSRRRSDPKSVATFLPKLVGFIIILVIGYFVAKAVSKVLDRVLEKVGLGYGKTVAVTPSRSPTR